MATRLALNQKSPGPIPGPPAMTEEELKLKIQKHLGKEIIRFALQGKGAVNFAYYIETSDGGKYIIKQERADKEFQPENDLPTEAAIAKQLYILDLSIHTPHVVFSSKNPDMYGYEYVEGELMKEIWGSLSEDEKISICQSLGYFHAEIGKKLTEGMSRACGVKIDGSSGLHPEVSEEYERLSIDPNVPDEFRNLAKKAKVIFDGTMDGVVFQFIHNDSHHENILIKEKKISGIIDFGNAEYGEIAKEFSRYIRDYPDYFQYIVSAYEEKSGNKLSYERLISNALLSGFVDIVENYNKGGVDRIKAKESIATYRRLLSK
jgi:Ser/Thr protein kinase RdoA (MazF antagonist)